tara:strand:+ start:739 stop:1959 length:1221 start_codon:yes stop_codon:yes gene_type:complete
VTFKAKIIVYTQKNQNKKGFAALIVCMISAVLAGLAFLTIQIGGGYKQLSDERQLLDTCAMSIGMDIIYTNDSERFCSNIEGLGCNLDFVNNQSQFSCIDRGLDCSTTPCKRKFTITSDYIVNGVESTDSSSVEIEEENHDVQKIDAAVVLLLDFSGSMQGNRIAQLKSAVQTFVAQNYDLDYSVILYNSDVINFTEISKGSSHDQRVLSIVNNSNPGGGTNFVRPLQKSKELIDRSDNEAYYIIMVSDGSPNEGGSNSINYVRNVLRNRDVNDCYYSTANSPCITLYSLAVDNADTSVLNQISGNAINQNPNEYSFSITANQVLTAFSAIIAEIVCRIGPVLSSNDLHIFNGITKLRENLDFVYDDLFNIVKFYDIPPNNICNLMLTNNSNITIRSGDPKIYAEF